MPAYVCTYYAFAVLKAFKKLGQTVDFTITSSRDLTGANLDSSEYCLQINFVLRGTAVLIG